VKVPREEVSKLRGTKMLWAKFSWKA
jgi:hypothetical protein